MSSVVVTFLAVLMVLVALTYAMPSVPVIANVRGKKYEVKADTVEEFSQHVAELTGIAADQQSVLFRGKVLSSSDSLEKLGISAGEVLNVVKGRRAAPSPMTSRSSVTSSTDVLSASSLSGLGGDMDVDSSSSNKSPEDILKDMDPQQLEDARRKMDAFIESDDFLKQFDDEEALEKQRQEMLDNMERYEKMMPGWSAQVSEIVSDPEKWKQAMANAKAQLMQLRESRRQQRSGVNPADTGLKNDSVDDINDEEEN
jgi:hypothetical protein